MYSWTLASLSNFCVTGFFSTFQWIFNLYKIFKNPLIWKRLNFHFYFRYSRGWISLWLYMIYIQANLSTILALRHFQIDAFGKSWFHVFFFPRLVCSMPNVIHPLFGPYLEGFRGVLWDGKIFSWYCMCS